MAKNFTPFIAITLFSLFCWSAAAAPSSSVPVMLSGLSTQEATSLLGGEALIREIKTHTALTLSGFDDEAMKIKKEIAALSPNYITEVIALIPYRDSANQIGKLATVLSDLDSYVGIPYWSAQMQKTYDLFDKMTITVKKQIPGGTYLESVQHMKPFEDYKASYEYRMSNDALIFHSTNLSHLVYKGIRSVAPKGMHWYLYVFRNESNLVYYAVGAVKAFDMMGLIRERLKVSFIGRVDAFFKHMFAQLEE